MSHMNADPSLDQVQSEFNPERSALARKRGFLALVTLVAVAASSYTAYWYFIGSRYVSTDNAYSAVEVAEVTPAVGGDR